MNESLTLGNRLMQGRKEMFKSIFASLLNIQIIVTEVNNHVTKLTKIMQI